MTLKIAPRSSVPTAQPSSPTSPIKRPVPQVRPDGFEPTSSTSRSLPTPPPPDMNIGQQAIDLARSVLGQTAHSLKLANSTALGRAMQDWPADNVNCANFVSGVLIASGQISQSQGSAGVSNLKNNLKAAGWQQVDPSQAQPGDVIVLIRNGKEQHVELVQGQDASGKLNLIGSNNVNADGTQSISENKYPSSYWSGCIVLHNPNAGAPATGPTPTGPTSPTTPSAPSGGASSVDGITANQSTWLRGNSSGPAVEELQKKLAAAGFDPGPLDGQFGPKTLAAVRAFQAAKGCQVDGIVGPETRAALMGGAQPSAAPPPSSGAEPPPPVSDTSATTGTTGAAPKNARERAMYAMSYFQQHGLTKSQAAGLTANLYYESGRTMDPHQKQIGGGPGYGIAQWEGPRQADFKKFTGVDIRNSTLDQQLAFVMHELNTTESAAGNALRRSTSAGDAANVILRQFERPAHPNASERARRSMAEKLMNGTI